VYEGSTCAFRLMGLGAANRYYVYMYTFCTDMSDMTDMYRYVYVCVDGFGQTGTMCEFARGHIWRRASGRSLCV